jgi:cytochrome c-type biogenesis protein
VTAGPTVPITIALASGALTVINPCGFPLLPAFLSFYLGVDERRLPRATTRVAQGLLVGGLVAAGFLAVFAVVALPVSYGVSAIAHLVPWAGLTTGGLLVVAGLLVAAGRRLPLQLPHLLVPVQRERRLGAMLLFGVGYGAASLGCALPILLSLIGASLGADKLAVFVAYAAGTTLVLAALSVSIALLREGAAQLARPLLAHLGAVAGLLLVASGGYLVYYWSRIRFGDSLTLADDPLVGRVTRWSAELQSFASDHDAAVLAGAGGLVAAALLWLALQWSRRRRTVTRGALAGR